MQNNRLERQLQFILEIDKLKLILRQTLLTDGSRRENSAEHSWHLAMMAILLAEYAPTQIDVLRVIKMLLVHDLVEIDAGDTFCYDVQSNENKAMREAEAANRLFGLLPEDQGVELRNLWEEFEAQETGEARFATALDRLQPFLHNQHTKGGTWQIHGITREQVQRRMQPIEEGAPLIWPFVQKVMEDCVEAGYLRANTET
ncbi:HD domain-containing protein [Microcoleus sp. FACHB-831]|uniref:HD domain-containing protein n=1 Tax=Microcoleus sp. FACHB-831 TaxID=2692827 RepID=UPI0016895D36|nr:HD domain-containing protein [Microcoleus sp. FACHB-831]MBD1923564.1 HD domain-containing protein [Microcoleus sp. FACHB-831]